MTIEGMNKNVAGKLASVRAQALRLAEEAAHRAGMGLEEWLDEAIIGRAAGDILDESDDEIRAQPSEQLSRAWLDEAEDFLESAITRIERRMRRGEERMARALETFTSVLERTRESIDRGCLSPAYRQPASLDEQQMAAAPEATEILGARITSVSHERPALRSGLDERLEEIAQRIEAARHWAHARNASLDANAEKRPSEGLAGQNAGATDREATEPNNSANEAISELATSASPPQDAPHEDFCGLGSKLDRSARERDERLCGVDLTAMREGIAEMNRSLAELAPRNAVVALEGAVRDLAERVALLRQDGEHELLLAPLDAMAAELRASLKARDPQPVVAGLEREISALASKVDNLAEAAISPESFDRIQRQTEGVRDLLAAAAARSAPLERLERQISELADRIEQLGVSPALNVESAQMAALLAGLRTEIESSAPLSALAQIGRRLEHIAARLDQEISRGVDSHALEDLAHRIDGVRQSVDTRLQPQIDTNALEASLKELCAKLENPSSEPLAAIMRDISDKLDAGGHKDAEANRDAIKPMLVKIIDKLDHLPQPELNGQSTFDRAPASVAGRETRDGRRANLWPGDRRPDSRGGRSAPRKGHFVPHRQARVGGADHLHP